MYSSEEFSNLVKNVNDLNNALLKNPYLVNAQDNLGMTLLHHAVVVTKVTNIIAIILEYNFNPDTLNSSGAPALTYALISESQSESQSFFIKSNYLLDKGANPLVGNKGQRPIDQVPIMQDCDAAKQLIQKMYTSSLLKILEFYKQEREQDSRYRFSILGGYNKDQKLNAVNALIAAAREKFSVSDDVLTICRQGRLGKLMKQWEHDTGTTITDVINNFSNSFTPNTFDFISC